MWQLMREQLVAGGGRGSDGGAIARGYQQQIQNFGQAIEHAKPLKAPAEGGPTPPPPPQLLDTLTQDIAKLERYKGDPALEQAHKALAEKPPNLGKAAEVIVDVAEKRIAALEASLATLKNPEQARRVAEGEDRDVPLAEKDLETRQELVEVAEEKLGKATGEFKRDVEGFHNNWSAIEDKTTQLLVDIPGHGDEEKAVFQALEVRDPLALAQALAKLQAKVDPTRAGQIVEIMGTKVDRPGWGTGDATLQTVLDLHGEVEAAKQTVAGAHAAEDTARAKLQAEQLEAANAHAALTVAEEYGQADKAVTELAGQVKTAWDRPENKTFALQASLVADMAPDAPEAAKAAKVALQQAVADRNPEAMIKATRDLLQALPLDDPQRGQLAQAIDKLMKATIITEKGVFKDTTTTLNALAERVDARAALAKPLSPELPTAQPDPETERFDDSANIPADEHAAPVDEHAAPVDEHAAPVDEHAAPVDEHAAPVDEHAQAQPAPVVDHIPDSISKLAPKYEDAAVDAALVELANHVKAGKKISPEDLKTITAGLGDALAKRLAAIPEGKLPLRESNARSPEAMALQRALLLADVLSGDQAVRDIGSQRSKTDYDIDGLFGPATRQSVKELVGDGPVDAACLAKLSGTLRGAAEATSQPVRQETKVVTPERQPEKPVDPEEHHDPEPDPSLEQTTVQRRDVPPQHTDRIDGPKDVRETPPKRPLEEATRIVRALVVERADGGERRIRDPYREFIGQEATDAFVEKVLQAMRHGPDSTDPEKDYKKVRAAFDSDAEMKDALKVMLQDILDRKEDGTLAYLETPGVPGQQDRGTMSA